jgi:hypothetical protein
MLGLTSDQGLLHLTADLRQMDSWTGTSKPKAKGKLLATQAQRFPPVEDVVAAIDHTAACASSS